MTPRNARLTRWSGDLPQIGEYLQTRSGTTYLILSFTENTRPNRKSVGSLKLLRLSEEDLNDIPKDAVINSFKWD